MQNERKLEFTNSIRVTRQTRESRNAKHAIYFRVFLTIHGRTKDFVVKSKHLIDLKQWDPKRQKVRGSSNESKWINSKLDRTQSSITTIFENLNLTEDNLTYENAKNVIRLHVFGKGQCIEVKKHYLNDLFDRYLSSDKNDLGESRRTRYALVKKRSAEFNRQEYKKVDFEIDNLNTKWYDSFKKYLKEKYNLKPQTLNGYLKVLKAVVNQACTDEILKRNPFKGCKLDSFTSEIKHLTSFELKKIIEYKFPNERTQTVADCFIFASETGLSHSDMKNITIDNIGRDESGYFLWGYRQKTKEEFLIPLSNKAISIIEKYKEYRISISTNPLLHVFHINEYNDILKRIAIHCGIEKKLSSHMARHSFATTTWTSNGGSTEVLQKILGHKSIRSTQTYSKITSKRVQLEAQKVFGKQNNIFLNTTSDES